MTDNAVIKGTYADFKLVKTRSVVQMVIEVPIEQASTVVDIFGIPNAAEERWVAVAALNIDRVERTEEATRAIQLAGMLCNTPTFGKWLNEMRGFHDLNENDNEAVAVALRELIGVQSRTEMHNSPEAITAFNRLKGEYDEWMIIGED